MKPAQPNARPCMAVPALLALALIAPGCGDDSECTECGAAQAGAGQGGAAGRSGSGGAGGNAGAAGSSGTSAGSGGTAGAAVDPSIPPGACVPEGPSADDLGAARTVVYSGPRALRAVAVRRSAVLVADEAAGLFRIAEGSTEFERVVEANVAQFLAADLNMYWYEDGAIWRASQNGTDATPDPVAQNLPSPIDLRAFDELNLYGIDAAAGAITTVPIAGETVTQLVTGVDVVDMKLHAGFLYYPDRASDYIYRLSVDGGNPESLTTPKFPTMRAVATDGETLYWTDLSWVVQSPVVDGEGREPICVSGPKAPSGRSPLVSLKLVDERLYWSDEAGNLGWTELDGSECALIVAGLAMLRGWDVDDTAAYVTVTTDATTSELWRIAL